jgi:hypothetical protein
VGPESHQEEKLKAISILEPWASLIRTGEKTYETRSWMTNYRGPLLICAARKKVNLLNFSIEHPEPELVSGYIVACRRLALNFGKAVALVKIVNCVPVEEAETIGYEKIYGDFTAGRFAWKLEMINNTFEPFPVKGRQGFFEVEIPEGMKL